MEVFRFDTGISVFVLVAYNIFIILFLLIGLTKNGLNRHALFITVLYSYGLFGFLEYQFGISSDIYKVLIAFFLVLICGKGVIKIPGRKGAGIYVAFLFFTLSYFITHYINGQFNISVLSQYVLTYSFLFIIYQGYKNLNLRFEKREKLIKIITFLLAVQVILSIIKVGLLGGVMEFIVGSIQFIGGGTAVSLPILGLLFFWVLRNGKFEKMDWFIALSFLIIAIASAKRTPVLMFPLFLILLFSFANSDKSLYSFLKYIPLFIGLVYVGVRLNYTLNPDGIIWGSFDLVFLYDYVLLYNFGTTDLSTAAAMTSGRGGALFLLTQPEALGLNGWSEVLFGNGITDAVRQESGRFLGGEGYGINHQGLMGAVVMEVYKIGYLGVGLFMLLIFTLINQIINNRFKLIVCLWLFVDIFLYYGTTIFNPACSFIFVLIIIMASNRPSSSPL